MTTDIPLREKDVTVLQALLDGSEDLFEVRQATTLSNRETNYIFDKLADDGLIEVTPQDGRVTRVVDGQEKSFEAPKKARVTESGVRAVDEFHEQGRSTESHMDMEREELVTRVRELESRVERLESGMSSFRKQVLAKLEQGSE